MPLSITALLLEVALAGVLLVFVLRNLSTRSGAAGGGWRLGPADLGGYTTRGLILSSVLSLFLELLLIRWISSEIRIFAYFKNFVLIACFLGFGVGCYLCRRAIPIVALIAPLLFFVLLIQLPWKPLRALITALPVTSMRQPRAVAVTT